jgi:hypothetical protein
MSTLNEFSAAVASSARSKWLGVIAKAATAAATLSGSDQREAIGDMRELFDMQPGVHNVGNNTLVKTFETPFAPGELAPASSELRFKSAVETLAIVACVNAFGELAVTRAVAPEFIKVTSSDFA